MRILINRSDALGDLILTLPMAIRLKEYFPQSQIAYIVGPGLGMLLKGHPHIDEVIELPRHRKIASVKDVLKKIHNFSATHYFYVGGARWVNWLVFLVGTKFRGGQIVRLSDYLTLKNGRRQYRSLVELHEAQYNEKILEVFRVPLRVREKVYLNLRYLIDPSEQSRVFEFVAKEFKTQNLEDIDPDRPIVVIHPGRLGHTLNWPWNRYVQLIRDLISDSMLKSKIYIAVSYTAQDQSYSEKIKSSLQQEKGIFFWDGNLHNLSDYIQFLSRSLLVVAPSTGPLHLAAGLGVAVLGIYSPVKVQSSFRWGPLACDENSPLPQVLVPDVICGEVYECAKEKCPYFECMPKISGDKVSSLVKEVILQQIQKRGLR